MAQHLSHISLIHDRLFLTLPSRFEIGMACEAPVIYFGTKRRCVQCKVMAQNVNLEVIRTGFIRQGLRVTAPETWGGLGPVQRPSLRRQALRTTAGDHCGDGDLGAVHFPRCSAAWFPSKSCCVLCPIITRNRWKFTSLALMCVNTHTPLCILPEASVSTWHRRCTVDVGKLRKRNAITSPLWVTVHMCVYARVSVCLLLTPSPRHQCL